MSTTSTRFSTILLLAMLFFAVFIDLCNERRTAERAAANGTAPASAREATRGRPDFDGFVRQFPPADLPFALDGAGGHDTILLDRKPVDPAGVRAFIARDTSFSVRDLDSAERETWILSYRIVPVARLYIGPSTIGLVYLATGAAGGANDMYRLMLWSTDGRLRASLPLAEFISEGAAGSIAEGRVEMVGRRYRVRGTAWRWQGDDPLAAARKNVRKREWTVADDGAIAKVR
jgi:hypothetical protein